MEFVNRLNKAEIGRLILLKYLDMTVEHSDVPRYFSNIYQINPDHCIADFWNEKYISYAAPDRTLTKISLTELKNIANDYNLSRSGKKSDLIKRIVENVHTSDLENYIKQKYIVVTEKGLKAISDGNIDFEYENRYTDFYIDDIETLFRSVSNGYFDGLSEGPFAKQHEKYRIKAIEHFLKDKQFKDLDKYLKTMIIICFSKGMRSETSVLSIKYYFNIDVDQKLIHYAMGFIRACSELFEAKTVFNTYKIATLNDEHTCPYCKSFENKVLDLNNAVVGINYPPFNKCQNKFCRCFATHDKI